MIPQLEKEITLTLRQTQDVYEMVDNMLDFMDEQAMLELYSGGENDVDDILGTFISTAKEVIHGDNLKLVKPDNFGYLTKFTAEVQETLRCRSLNYFVLDCLPNFTLGYHNIEWFNISQIHKNFVLLAARDHSKSFSFSFAFPLWQLYRYKRGKSVPKELQLAKEGLIITNERSLSNHFLGMIKEEIEENLILRERLFPEGRGKGWGGESIKTRNGAVLFVRSATSKLRGRHPTWIVCDDLLNESSLYSQEQRDKYWNIFSGVIVPMIEPMGSIKIIGTPFSQNDLYHTIRNKRDLTAFDENGKIKNKFNFPVFEYPAIFPDGQLLFPQRHDFESLMEKEAILGKLIFSREILVKPISDGASIFPYEELHKSIRGQNQVDTVKNISQVDPKRFIKIGAGVDFAISGAIGADYTVITIGGLDKFGTMHVFNSIRLKGANYKKQIAALKKANRDFNLDIIYAEDNGMQKVFIQMMEDAGLPVAGKTTTAANKKSLYFGVPRMASFFETSKIKFPYKSQSAKDMTDLYHSELNSITFIPDTGKLESTTQHDDTAMSLWNLCRALKGENMEFDFSFL